MSSKYDDHQSGRAAPELVLVSFEVARAGRALLFIALGRLKEDWLSIGAKDALERRADLVQRAVLPRALENVGHRVLGARSSGAERLEPVLAGSVVALAADLGEPLVLLRFHVLADLQERDRQLGLVGHELVHADDHAPMLLDLPLLPRRRLGDLALEPSLLESADHAADAVDLGKD